MKVNILSSTQLGVESLPVTVETEIIGSTKRFSIIGLPDNILRESRDRVRCAIENSGFSFPNREVIVSLSPAALPKKGAGFDLPIALSVLAACGYLPSSKLGDYLAFAELKLDGTVCDLSGALSAYVLASKLKRNFLTSSDYSKRHLDFKDNECILVNTLLEAVDLFKTGQKPEVKTQREKENQVEKEIVPNFSDVIGQFAAKRAMEVAAAGGHNVLLIGPPGAGKSMIAERLSSLLPPLSAEEQVEILQIQESTGMAESFEVKRPFRAPHHTTSYAGLIGGGSFPKAGEISLAHRGILFLDELPEFRKDVLETLRQPLEKKEVLISRAKQQLKFPANFTLIAAMNSCPCGRLGNGETRNKFLGSNNSLYSTLRKGCRCSPEMIRRYSGRISSPLLDRIDMFLWLKPVSAEKLNIIDCGEDDPTPKMKQNVLNAVKRQESRFKISDRKNSSMSGEEISNFCKMSPSSLKFLNSEVRRLEMSNRAYVRALRLSRTIADLGDSSEITEEHLAEALRFKEPPEVFNL